MNYSFNRFVRTPHSEVYFVFDQRREKSSSIGEFHVHFDGRLYVGCLALETDPSQEDLAELRSACERIVDISGERDDFLLTIFSGKELGEYSDTVSEKDRQREPATREDLAGVDASLRRVLGRHQAARGILNEHALMEYFSRMGFSARRATPAEDHAGIDVVAESDDIVVFAQAKLGSGNVKAVKKLAKAVASAEVHNKKKMGFVVANSFPPDIEFQRILLESEHGINLACVSKAHVLAAVPGYRHALD